MLENKNKQTIDFFIVLLHHLIIVKSGDVSSSEIGTPKSYSRTVKSHAESESSTNDIPCRRKLSYPIRQDMKLTKECTITEGKGEIPYPTKIQQILSLQQPCNLVL